MTVLLKKHQKVLSFMENKGIPLLEENIVDHKIHAGWKMANVQVNGVSIMTGNFWDFYPGCHGIALPNFNNSKDLAEIFNDALKAFGKKSSIVVDKEWVYTY